MSIDILFLGGTSIDLIQDAKNKSRLIASTGGSVTNTAVICAKLGVKTAMLSRIGKDPLGDFAVSFLKAGEIDTSGLIQDPSIKTPLAIAAIDKSGNAGYTFYKNHPGDSVVPLKSVPKGLLNGLKLLHLGSSFSHQLETFRESLKYIDSLKKRGAFISLDPNIRPYALREKKAVKNRVFKLLRLVDMAKLSRDDLFFLTSQKDIEKGMRRLKKRFRCELVLTLGAKGSAYIHPEGKLLRIPAFKVRVADTIGAGDAFTAGLLYKIGEAGATRVFSDIKQHLVFASAVSAIICTKPGANQALKDMGQVRRFLSSRKLPKMRHDPKKDL